jgi:hypothetical protein
MPWVRFGSRLERLPMELECWLLQKVFFGALMG